MPTPPFILEPRGVVVPCFGATAGLLLWSSPFVLVGSTIVCVLVRITVDGCPSFPVVITVVVTSVEASLSEYAQTLQ